MRKTGSKEGLYVHAVVGSYVVLFGMDVDEHRRKGLLGFALKRGEPGKEGRFLGGIRKFDGTSNEKTLVDTNIAPIQDFMWGDYTAKPATKYHYEIFPVYGAPDDLSLGEPVKLDVETEALDEGAHAIHFNRGVAGSQGYARLFENKRPDQVPNGKAYKWLGRGLPEALVGFLQKAENEDYSIRAAVYEFTADVVVSEFKAALERGVDVKIVYDYRRPEDPKHTAKPNKEALKRHGLAAKTISLPRTKNTSYISHNKFIVLLYKGKPIEVLTGSTNMTKGGIYGHANLVHIVRNEDVAAQYLAYWEFLASDPDAKALKIWTEKHNKLNLTVDNGPAIVPIFSPRKSLDVLNFYVNLIDQATSGAFITAAFGLSEDFEAIYAKDKPYLRHIILEKIDKELADKALNDPDVRIAIGRHLSADVLDEWFIDAIQEEALTQMNVHVRYIHTKALLIDPLGETPIVVTGSANFSRASTNNNDENMLLIVGDKRVADIYLTEFMRLFQHFYWRSSDLRPSKNRKKKVAPHFEPLRVDDSWTDKFFNDEESVRFKQREYFCPRVAFKTRVRSGALAEESVN